jgi:hypothetical protein
MNATELEASCYWLHCAIVDFLCVLFAAMRANADQASATLVISGETSFLHRF